MVRLDAFGSQVGLLVVIMRGAYLLESTVCKYRAREAFLKAASIQMIPTAGKNKKHHSLVKLAKVIIRAVAKNARKRVFDGDYSLWSVIDSARVITPSTWLKTLFLAVRICRLIRCLSACRSSQFC